MKKRIRLKKHEAVSLGFEFNKIGEGNPKFYLNKDQFDKLKKIRELNNVDFKEVKRTLNSKGQVVSSVEKLTQNRLIDIPEGHAIKRLSTNPTTGQQWVITEPTKDEKDAQKEVEEITDVFDKIVSKYSKGVFRGINKSKIKDLKALKATTSDDHVGLEPNPDGEGLFGYEYSGGIYTQSIDKVFNSIIKEYDTHGKFDLLLLDNLGDEQDGWNGFTTRGGHKLDQNMTNAEVFDVCVDTKVNLIINLIDNNVANKFIMRKVTNDNHSSDFGLLVNMAVKKIIDRIYSQEVVVIESLTRFLEHRIYGDHAFILTHGKDKSKMFKGLPFTLNDKAVNFINDYIRFYGVNSKFIHLEKGDLHRIGFEKTVNFDYRNFMSLAPPSSWVQHNFGDSYSGYSIQVIPKHSNEISHTDYFLDYKRKI